MKRLIREPLLHFILLGAALFAISSLRSDSTTEAMGGQVVISAGRIENLTALFVKTWQRPPTAEELRGLEFRKRVAFEWLDRDEIPALIEGMLDRA